MKLHWQGVLKLEEAITFTPTCQKYVNIFFYYNLKPTFLKDLFKSQFWTEFEKP